MSGDSGAAVIELDNCSQWNHENNDSYYNTGIPHHREIEWLETCIGHQRWVLLYKSQRQVSTCHNRGVGGPFTDCLKDNGENGEFL